MECSSNKKAEERSKEKLKEEITKELTFLWTKVLDLTSVAVDGKDRRESLRGKILTLGNNSKRALHTVLDRYYKVEYVPNKETIIEVKRTTEKEKGNG